LRSPFETRLKCLLNCKDFLPIKSRLKCRLTCVGLQASVFGGEGAAAAAELNLQLLDAPWVRETLAVLVELLPAERVVCVVEADPAVLCHAAPVVRDTSERGHLLSTRGVQNELKASTKRFNRELKC
jgi:hypothetical protein